MGSRFRPRSKRGSLSPDVFRSVRSRERRHMRRRWQWVALGVVVVLLLIAASVVYLYYSTAGRIQEGIPPVEPPRREGDPYNTLLVGSDSRAGLTEREKQNLGADDEGIAGERADTLIIAHVDPATDRVTMVQFPRDLYVPVVGRGTDRINSALTEGKSALVTTVERLTGLDINHYVQVNIAGFRDLVDAIDGVDVCIPEPIEFDSSTGIEVPEPGMIHFSGNRALRFVRSRKVFAEGDFARIANQQKFIAAAIAKITSVETLIHPGRIRALINAAGDNLRVDRNTDPLELYRLGERFRAFDPSRWEAYTVPNRGPQEVDGKEVVLPDRRSMGVMFDAIGDNESPSGADGVPAVEPSVINVGVYNGTFEEGAALEAARRLERATNVGAGPVVIDDANIANAGSFTHRRTVVRYSDAEPEAARMGRLVAAALPGADLEAGRTKPGVDVAVIVGRRLRITPIVQILPLPIPEPGALPKVCRQ